MSGEDWRSLGKEAVVNRPDRAGAMLPCAVRFGRFRVAVSSLAIVAHLLTPANVGHPRDTLSAELVEIDRERLSRVVASICVDDSG